MSEGAHWFKAAHCFVSKLCSDGMSGEWSSEEGESGRGRDITPVQEMVQLRRAPLNSFNTS